MAVTKEDIVARASSMAFGKPLIMNVLRAMIVETIVDSALSLDWKWCSTDYAGWDFEHSDLTRLEVKQSSALQSWKTPKRAPRFSTSPHVLAIGLMGSDGSKRRPDTRTFMCLPAILSPTSHSRSSWPVPMGLLCHTIVQAVTASTM